MPTSIDHWLNELPQEIERASRRIVDVVKNTRLLHSPFYSHLSGANVYFKCEHEQVTGSFKIRGATNRFLKLPDDQRELVVAASTGNHGKAVAKVAKQFGANCRIFAPTNALPAKLDGIKMHGAQIVLSGDDCVQAEYSARQFALEQGAAYLSPYNDPDVVAGQGTIGLELCEQLGNIDAIFGAVGGGGMLGGIASMVRSKQPNCEIVACAPEKSCVMIRSLERGQLFDFPSEDTWSDGTAGGVEKDAITFELCQRMFQQTSLVTEAEIAGSFCQFHEAHQMLIEGSAAVPIASFLKMRENYQGKNVVIVLCGGNIGSGKLAEILNASGATASPKELEIE